MTLTKTHWTARLADYNDATTAEREYYEGEFRAVSDADDSEKARLIQAYGSIEAARTNPIGKAAWEKTWKSVEDAERVYERFSDAVMTALFAVMLTPAPDFPAALTKIALAIEHEYDELMRKPESALESIRRDIEALAAA